MQAMALVFGLALPCVYSAYTGAFIACPMVQPHFSAAGGLSGLCVSPTRRSYALPVGKLGWVQLPSGRQRRLATVMRQGQDGLQSEGSDENKDVDMNKFNTDMYSELRDKFAVAQEAPTIVSKHGGSEIFTYMPPSFREREENQRLLPCPDLTPQEVRKTFQFVAASATALATTTTNPLQADNLNDSAESRSLSVSCARVLFRPFSRALSFFLSRSVHLPLSSAKICSQTL